MEREKNYLVIVAYIGRSNPYTSDRVIVVGGYSLHYLFYFS